MVVTDAEGRAMLESFGIQPDRWIVVKESDLEREHRHVFALRKLRAYALAQQAVERWLHVDLDVLLWECPPEDAWAVDVFAQSTERFMLGEYIAAAETMVPGLDWAQWTPLNAGVFRIAGTAARAYEHLAEFYLRERSEWFRPRDRWTYQHSIVIEQLFGGIAAEAVGVRPHTLFSEAQLLDHYQAGARLPIAYTHCLNKSKRSHVVCHALIETDRTRIELPLGSAIEAVAQPIAGFLDRTLGTTVASCGACKAAKDALNFKARSDDPTRPMI